MQHFSRFPIGFERPASQQERDMERGKEQKRERKRGGTCIRGKLAPILRK